MARAEGQEEVEPWRFPRMVIGHVGLTLLGVRVSIGAMTATPIALGHAGFTEETSYDWLVASGTPSKRMDAVDSAESMGGCMSSQATQ